MRHRRSLQPTRRRRSRHPTQSRQPPRPTRSHHQHPLRTRHWTWSGRSSMKSTRPSPGWVARQLDRPPPSPPHRSGRPHPDRPRPNQPRRSFMTGRGGKRRRQKVTAASTHKRSGFRAQSRCAGGAASPDTPAARARLRQFSSAPGAEPSG
jgi:hypothetical protein